jgi:hypothetical protein
MHNSYPQFPERDIRFMVASVFPDLGDRRGLLENAKSDQRFVEAMLGDERLFQRLTSEERVLLEITPKLFFSVLLRQARKDLTKARYTMETRARQKIPVFDTHLVVGLLGKPGICSYLADMLTSFTRVESFAWRVRVREGIWRKHRVSDLDIDGLIKLCEHVDEFYRFSLYKRIGDVCLFLTGMFPEYVARKGDPFAALRGRRRDLEDYEQDGADFYQLAAEHEVAAIIEVNEVLETLSSDFALAEKPLKFLSEHYLLTRKHTLFGLQDSLGGRMRRSAAASSEP